MGSRTESAIPGATVQQQALPENAYDLLNESERRQMETMRVTDPTGYDRVMSTLSVRLADQRMKQANQPLMQTQARILVDQYKMDMRMRDPENYEKIAPIFESSLVADLTPLVGMTNDQRTRELALRWNAAEGIVLKQLRSTQKPVKSEPTITASTSPGSSLKSSGQLFEEDDWMARMDATYKFTEAQKRILQELA
jgi:hypothetical protein